MGNNRPSTSASGMAVASTNSSSRSSSCTSKKLRLAERLRMRCLVGTFQMTCARDTKGGGGCRSNNLWERERERECALALGLRALSPAIASLRVTWQGAFGADRTRGSIFGRAPHGMGPTGGHGALSTSERDCARSWALGFNARSRFA